jgi:hypothetical protein
MVVGEYVSFDEIEGLGQVDPGMTYPDSPPENSAKPYRVSAYVKNTDGTPMLGVDVGLYQADGKTLIETKKTDSSGKVFFDVATDADVTIVPQVPNASPPYAKVTPLIISPGFFKYLFVVAWSWGSSVNFTNYPAIPAAPIPISKTMTPGDVKSIVGPMITVGIILAGGYLIYHLSKVRTSEG